MGEAVKRGALLVVAQLIGVGWYVSFCIMGGLLGGLWLDRKFDTVPVATLSGVVVGSVMALYGVYKMLLPLLRR